MNIYTDSKASKQKEGKIINRNIPTSISSFCQTVKRKKYMKNCQIIQFEKRNEQIWKTCSKTYLRNQSYALFKLARTKELLRTRPPCI